VYRPEALGYAYKANSDVWWALETVRQRLPDLELHLVAPDGLPVVCPLPHIVHEAPDDAAMAEFYRAANLFVLASTSEGYSLCTLEAMACGTPAVLTDGGGIRDYAEPGRNCYMGVAGNVSMLVDLIMAALNLHDMTARHCAAGLETAKERSWNGFIDQAEKALRAELGGLI
jgi:glycosyltransferase involved in cell wall biosynthesis